MHIFFRTHSVVTLYVDGPSSQFARAGIGMNVLSLGVVMLATVTQWEAMFDLTGEQPGWAADAGGNGGSGAENATDFCAGVI